MYLLAEHTHLAFDSAWDHPLGLLEPHCLYLHHLYPLQKLPGPPVNCALDSPSSPSLCPLSWFFCLSVLFPLIAPCFPPIVPHPQTLYRMMSFHLSASRNSSGDSALLQLSKCRLCFLIPHVPWRPKVTSASPKIALLHLESFLSSP